MIKCPRYLLVDPKYPLGLTRHDLALLLKALKPEHPDAVIAQLSGLSRQLLFRDPRYQHLKRLLNIHNLKWGGGRGELRRGNALLGQAAEVDWAAVDAQLDAGQRVGRGMGTARMRGLGKEAADNPRKGDRQ